MFLIIFSCFYPVIKEEKLVLEKILVYNKIDESEKSYETKNRNGYRKLQ